MTSKAQPQELGCAYDCFLRSWTCCSAGRFGTLLARTLAALVRRKSMGLTSGSLTNGNLRLIANHAGCALVESDDEVDRLRLSLEAARGPRIFLLRCGQAPGPGFIEEAKQFPGTNDSG
jgi:hypothetical protein